MQLDATASQDAVGDPSVVRPGVERHAVVAQTARAIVEGMSRAFGENHPALTVRKPAHWLIGARKHFTKMPRNAGCQSRLVHGRLDKVTDEPFSWVVRKHEAIRTEPRSYMPCHQLHCSANIVQYAVDGTVASCCRECALKTRDATSTTFNVVALNATCAALAAFRNSADLVGILTSSGSILDPAFGTVRRVVRDIDAATDVLEVGDIHIAAEGNVVSRVAHDDGRLLAGLRVHHRIDTIFKTRD